eukprot:TRINITY_DN6057_c0_g1_i7.p8 TRINITY_DN6057_c0_g1~~TRINITY_DN6057_c0_g1_i7.p8  ORF type:complete len:100 (+),score=4.72 TRINITY_DN6057_c0_g1_i7:311-610(+)
MYQMTDQKYFKMQMCKIPHMRSHDTQVEENFQNISKSKKFICITDLYNTPHPLHDTIFLSVTTTTSTTTTTSPSPNQLKYIIKIKVAALNETHCNELQC